MTIYLPEEKGQKIVSRRQKVLSMEKVSLGKSTSLIGKLSSTYLAVLSSRATAAANKKIHEKQPY